MNKATYQFAIFLHGLFVVANILQSVLYLQLDGRLFTLQSFSAWFVVMTAIYLACTTLILRYFHFKRYHVALWITATNTIAMIVHGVVFYVILTTRQLQEIYPLVTLLIVVGALVSGASLIFSHAAERPWLKAAGVATVAINMLVMVMFIWIIVDPTYNTYSIAEPIGQWLGLILNIVPVLFIRNFVTELETVEATSPASALDLRMWTASLIALAACGYLAPQLVKESRPWIGWDNRSPEHGKALADAFEAGSFTNPKGTTLQYRLMKPLHYDSTKKYPLVVCLHGSSGTGTDNISQVEVSWSAQFITRPGNREKYEAFVFVPQCPPGTSWGGMPILTSIDTVVFDAIAALERQYTIDEHRRYVIGESLGGYGSWHFISSRPDMFAAAVPICGGGDPAYARAIAHVPVWAFHGAKDKAVPVNLSRNMVTALKDAGGTPRYNEFPNEGHAITHAIEPLGVFDWMFAQQRK